MTDPDSRGDPEAAAESPGVERRAQPGAQPGTQSGTPSETQTGTPSETQPETQPEAQSGSQPGSQPGSEPGTELSALDPLQGQRAGLSQRLLLIEVGIVLALSLGRSGVFSTVSFIADLTSGAPLADQAAVLNASLAPGRPLLDLVRQLLRITFSLAPVALIWYLLVRSGDGGVSGIGFDRRQPARDTRRGVLLAAGVGSVGLAFYLIAYRVGANLVVVAEDLPEVWWRGPVLVASAMANAVVEETIVVGFLILRLRQARWSPFAAVATSAALRGSYHLYQGLGGMLGNAAMGALFGWLYLRWGRVMPLVIAHALIDIVAFLGYALLGGRVDWLP